ncbi:MAG: acetate--CoA ligase [Anaerolineae bacterium]|nr:acetate--CoA ligase [Anaerolineae bacterium]
MSDLVLEARRVADIEEAEHEVYVPDPGVVEHSYIKDPDAFYAESVKDIPAFWESQAEGLDWYKKWDRVLDDSRAPFYRWFVGGKTNIVLNALDRHVKTWRKNKLALIWEGEPGDSRTMSYYALNREVNKFSNVLRGMGVKKGDRVTIYMGRIPEIMVAMLACAKIGAIHSVVFGGFSENALGDRIEDAQSRVLITQDGNWLRGKVIDLKTIVDAAIRRSPVVEKVIVVQRANNAVNMEAGRDFWYHDLMSLPIAMTSSETEVMEATDPLYMLYTSGSTGKPKGLVHLHGGYQVGIASTLKYAFDVSDEDRWWCAADPGWVTGHSYIVYAPLILGLTSFMYEGAPNFPYPDRWWQLIAKYGISHFYTAPTAIRGLMRFGPAWPKRHDLSTLKVLGTVGEPINPEAWRWYYRYVGQNRCPVIDTWWQTETGAFMITPTPARALKPGSATRPFPGIVADVVDENGESTEADQEGFLVIKHPWPAMLAGIYGDPDRYVNTYWGKFPGVYLAGDAARKDADGYFWVIGRIDDVINVSGHRLGTAEIESALVSHPAVAEAAAIGLPDEVKGQGIHCWVLLRNGYQASDALAEDLKLHVRREISPIASPDKIYFPSTLPKTRSGKIMRRVLKARALGMAEGDVSTLEE